MARIGAGGKGAVLADVEASAMFSPMPNRWIIAGLAVAAVVGLVFVWSRIRYDVVPKRLVAVEEGFLYRSGQISARLIGGVLDDKGIDTVISLVGYDAARPDHVAEKAAAEERGIRNYVHIGTGNREGVHLQSVSAQKLRCKTQPEFGLCRLIIVDRNEPGNHVLTKRLELGK